MPTAIQSILRKATKQPNETLNIITFKSEPHYDISLCETGHDFWVLDMPGTPPWPSYYPMPSNYHIIPNNNGQAYLPLYIDFDLILIHDRGAQYELAATLGKDYQLPIILLEHGLPPAEWNESRLLPARAREGSTNVFVAECQRKIWGFHPEYPCFVNPLGVNTNLFSPADDTQREDALVWFGNNIMHKDEIHGFPIMRYITGFPMPMMPIKIVGDNPGISRLPKTLDELVSIYRKAGVLLNTCPNNPLPITVLEAMACGCPVVSLDVGDISQFIKNGDTGFTSKNPDDLRNYCGMVLADKELSNKIGNNARELIRKKFGLTRFTKTWQQILTTAIED